jgi:hypothetical protein
VSYTVDIVNGPVPDDNKAAWTALETWREELYADSEASPEMRALHDKLVMRYPCIMVDDEGPWSDGPLIDDFGKRMGIIGVVYSRVDEVLPFVIETSLAMGFTGRSQVNDATPRSRSRLQEQEDRDGACMDGRPKAFEPGGPIKDRAAPSSW